MTVRTDPRPAAAARPVPAPARPDRRRPPTAGARDDALDEALEHITDLAERLWAVRRVHPPVRTRSLLGGVRVRCGGCGHPSPCPTLRAAAPAAAGQ